MIFQTVCFLTQKTRNSVNQKAIKHSSLAFSCQSDGKPTCDSFHSSVSKVRMQKPKSGQAKTMRNLEVLRENSGNYCHVCSIKIAILMKIRKEGAREIV